MSIKEIRENIHVLALRMVQTNSFLVKAKAGTLSRSEIAVYLFNLMHVFRTAPEYLTFAANRADELNLTQVSAFMRQKFGEELGHDQWAKDDLKNYSADISRELTIHPETVEIISYVKRIIEQDPRLYLAYMTFVEYLTVVSAPEFLKSLEEKCDVKRSEITAIANHEVADQHHSEENFEYIERFILDTPLEADFCKVVEETYFRVGWVLSSCVH
jgi:hypothetical protein